jgi:glycosyltransferase involved in cell wall biosynthesis
MRIVMIGPFAFSPKATVSARMLPMATALVRRGHAVTILMPPYDNPADSNKHWEHEGVRLENMSLTGAPEGATTLLDLAQQLANRVRSLAPDALHVFKPIGVGALAQWHLRSAYAKRMLVDNDDWEGRGGWLDVNPYPLPRKLFGAWQESWSLRAARQVSCASHTLIERTNKLRGDSDNTLLFPNGPDNGLQTVVSAAETRRDALRERFGWRGQTIAIYTGTIPHGHDMDMAVRAIAAAPDSVRWVIVATGDGIPSLKQTIAQAGIGERVAWHGFMPHDALVERLVASDIALYPYRDTPINRAKCSGKVIDYMAAGKPMVVSDVGMNRAYLEHERSALLTPAGNADAFTAATLRLLNDPALWGALGRAAQLRVWREFGWDARIPALEQLYLRDSAGKGQAKSN